MTININPDEIVDPFAVAPEGAYTVECVHAEERESRAGDQMVEMRLRITDGDVDDIDEHIGKNIFDYMVIVGEYKKYGEFRLSQYCEAAGLDISKLEAEELIGASFEVQVSIQPPTPEFDSESNRINRVYVD